MVSFTYPFSTPSEQQYPVPPQVGASVPAPDWDPSPAMERLAVTDVPFMPQHHASMEQSASYSNGQANMAYSVMEDAPAHYPQAEPMGVSYPVMGPSSGYAPYFQQESTQHTAIGGASVFNPPAEQMGTQQGAMGPPVDYHPPGQYTAMQPPVMTSFSGFNPPAQRMDVPMPMTQSLPVNHYQPVEARWDCTPQQPWTDYQPMPYHPTGMPLSFPQQAATVHQSPACAPSLPSTTTVGGQQHVAMGASLAPAPKAALPVKRKRGRPTNAEKDRAAAALREQGTSIAAAAPSLAPRPQVRTPPPQAPANAAPTPGPATLAQASALPTFARTALTPPPLTPAALSVPAQETFDFTVPPPFDVAASPSLVDEMTPEPTPTTIDPAVLNLAESAPTIPIPPRRRLAGLLAESARIRAQGRRKGVSRSSGPWKTDASKADSEWFKYRGTMSRSTEFQMATGRKRMELMEEREMMI